MIEIKTTMVLREINITRFQYDRLKKDKQPVTILVVGQNDGRRKALCNTILRQIYPDGTSQQENDSPFVYYNNPELRLLAVRVVDEYILTQRCQYVVLMEDATDLKRIWESTNCQKTVSKFATFKTIFENCAKDCEVLWIDAKTDTVLPGEKLFWAAYTYVEDIADDTAKQVLFDLPQKISHLNEKDDDDENPTNTDPNLPDGYCTIL